ncbi:MAG: SIMPL domain-containing protein [Pyrinomonadaceae bacterium]|nr:SIMPL domain-containing protein [Pyrinomonadaceae bacterium]
MNDKKKFDLMNIGVALAIGLIVSSMLLGWAYTSGKKEDDALKVTGSAKKRIKSDLVSWSADVSYRAPKLATAYDLLSENVPRVKKYLIEKGIKEEQITVSSISSTTLHGKDLNGNSTQEIIGYSLGQSVHVRSKDVDLVAKIARESTELIKQGILLDSNSPQYFYTKLGDLKIEMLGEAAKDARLRAEEIANATGSSIGTIRSARMGVMQITAADSTEVSDYGISDTSSIHKDLTAVVNANFAVY